MPGQPPARPGDRRALLQAHRGGRPAGAARRALPGQQQDDTGFDAGQTRVLELAAAQPFQVAVDAFFPAADGREAFHGGAFTTFMVQQLWKAPDDVTYEEVFEEAYVSEQCEDDVFALRLKKHGPEDKLWCELCAEEYWRLSKQRFEYLETRRRKQADYNARWAAKRAARKAARSRGF